MKGVEIICLIYLAFACVEGATNKPLHYPEVRRDETVIDDYHGTKVPDPYRWLEDPDSNETKEFVQKQNALTRAYLEKAPYRQEIRDKLTEAWNYPKRSVPQKRGNKYFHFLNSGLQNQRVLMVQDTLEDTPKVFFDPNLLSEDGTIAMGESSFSRDGQLFAYSLAQSGSDWVVIHVQNVSTGEHFPEVLREIKFSFIIWTADNLGFFYTRIASPNSTNNNDGTETKEVGQEKLYYHRVGTYQEKDVVAVEFNERPNAAVYAAISNDGEYLIVTTFLDINENSVYFAPLKEALATNFESKLKLTLINKEPGQLTYVTNDESLFYFITNIDAPNCKLVRVDLNNPDKKYWSTVVPESKQVLQYNSVTPINQNMMFIYSTKDVKGNLELRHLQNGSLIRDFPLEIGSIEEQSGEREDTEFFFQLTTFTNPGVIYRVDLSNNDYNAVKYAETALKFNTSSIAVEQVFYKSKDGTKVPMYLLHKKDLVRDGSAPALQFGYGAFSVILKPFYSTSNLIFVDNFHGVVALPGVRGGGEYGKEWWDSGRLLNKQNSFDDFAAAAEYLIANNYTTASKITINGASAGGLLLAATVNQRPELFGAAIPEKAAMDLLRFQKFTGGHLWCGESGCSDNKTHFDNLLTYSALHNIRMPKDESAQYPAVLVKTADHDNRVVPLHSYKYTAELQKAIGLNSRQTNPLLISIAENDGHGAGTPTSKQIDQNVENFAFMVRALNLTFYK